MNTNEQTKFQCFQSLETTDSAAGTPETWVWGGFFRSLPPCHGGGPLCLSEQAAGPCPRRPGPLWRQGATPWSPCHSAAARTVLPGRVEREHRVFSEETTGLGVPVRAPSSCFTGPVHAPCCLSDPVPALPFTDTSCCIRRFQLCVCSPRSWRSCDS